MVGATLFQIFSLSYYFLSGLTDEIPYLADIFDTKKAQTSSEFCKKYNHLKSSVVRRRNVFVVIIILMIFTAVVLDVLKVVLAVITPSVAAIVILHRQNKPTVGDN